MARIPQNIIDEIQQAADIVSYVSRYVALKRAGKNMKGLCPFHKEKTPSFTVSPEKQIYHCFGCGKGGNVLGFVMAIENIGYIEAIRKIAFDLGIKIPVQQSAQSEAAKSEFELLYHTNQRAKEFFTKQLYEGTGTTARQYLKKRQLKASTVKLFELGYAPDSWDALLKGPAAEPKVKMVMESLGLVQKKDDGKGYFDKFRNRLMFPFHNTSGRIVGFGGRGLKDNIQPKYLNSPESKIYRKGELLYGLYQAIDEIRSRKFVLLVEGYFDLLRLVDSGLGNVVASSGTALTENQGRLLKRYTGTVVIAYDSDAAGIKSAIRNSQILESIDLSVFLVRMPPPHDPDSYVLEFGKESFNDLLNKKISPIDFRLEEFLKNPEWQDINVRNRFIDEIITDLLDLPSDVRSGLYIHRTAEVLEIAESFLISRFNQLKKQRRFRKTPQAGTQQEESVPIQVKSGRWQAEENILALLLRNEADITKHILHDLTASDFKNKPMRDIFESISHMWEDTGEVNLEALVAGNEDESQHSLLTKLQILEINNEMKLADDCIYQMRKWSLESRFNEIKRLITEESDSHKSVMHYMKELNTIRKKLSEIDKQRNTARS